MNKTKNWSYIYDKKLDMYIPNLPRQKKLAKVFLIFALMSFVALLIQIYFFDKTSEAKILFLVYTSVMFFLFLAIYLLLKINIHLLEKRLQEIEKIELSDKFEIKSLRKNIWLFSYIILFIILIFMLFSQINILLKELAYKYIFYTILLIGIIIFNCYNFLRELNARKYFLTICGKTIKIYYENNEKEFITTDNISQIRFYVIDPGRGIGNKNPTLQIFNNEEKILVEMTIKAIDYYLLKKYFRKYNVVIDDLYDEF
nr:hypothetical protein [uncultured Fusobacterium sp.]